MIDNPKIIVRIANESVPTRWDFSIDLSVKREIERLGLNNIVVQKIIGEQTSSTTSPGAFIDFESTNLYKNTQINKTISAVINGEISSGSTIFFDDAWNVCILQLKYVIDLLNLDIRLVGFWHAGQHDEYDFLGRLMKGKAWPLHTERALYEALDINCFATNFYKNMFVDKVFNGNIDESKLLIAAQPHEQLVEELKNFPKSTKKDLVVFQHRISIEKQPEIFRDIASHMPDVECIICQENQLTKLEYYSIVSRAKLAFSASNQETFGIAMGVDAPLLGCIPLMPTRLSYLEIFDGYEDFFYPNEWTTDWDTYIEHRDLIIAKIRHMLFEYYVLLPQLTDYCKNRLPQYTVPNKLINTLLEI